MHRFLYGVVVSVGVLAAVPAWAANTGKWVRLPESGGALVEGSDVARGPIAFRWAATADTPNFVYDTSTESKFIFVSGEAFSFRIEPDKTSTNTAARADIFACTEPDVNSCSPLQWDTDADGVADDNTLDPTNPEAIGTPVFLGLVWIYVDPTVAPDGSVIAEVTLVAEKE